jgi:hypothetical protein
MNSDLIHRVSTTAQIPDGIAHSRIETLGRADFVSGRIESGLRIDAQRLQPPLPGSQRVSTGFTHLFVTTARIIVEVPLVYQPRTD